MTALDRPTLSGTLKGVLWVIVLVSGVVNLLTLTGSFYMLQVYDRVLTSHSVPTLIAMSVLAIGLYAIQGLLEIIRSQILVRVANRVDRKLMVPAHDAAIRLPLYGRSSTEAMQPIRDVESLRNFIAGQSLVALIDLPWFPLYLGFVFLLHPMLGWLATAAAGLLMLLTILTEVTTRSASKEVTKAASQRQAIAEANVRNADVLRAMGFGSVARRRFAAANQTYLLPHRRINDIAGSLGGLSKVLRMVLQSAVLGLGAFLVLKGELTAGAIIAASIASSRALAPIEAAIGNWKMFVAARQSWARLKSTFAALPAYPETMPLPRPSKGVAVEAISVPVPGTQKMILTNVSMQLSAGQSVGIVGENAAGKSTLARALVGVWPLARGCIRIDGATLDRWSEDAISDFVGYLPQDVELIDGSISENISRFAELPDPTAIIAAAEAAQIHEMILRLPDGYETRVGDRGNVLSAGQRQRIALARALYKDPFLVVLDEPNSNLDAEGEKALSQATRQVTARGGIVVIVAHRPSVLAAVDLIAVVGGGQITAFGPRDEVLRAATRTSAPQPAASAATSLTLVAEAV